MALHHENKLIELKCPISLETFKDPVRIRQTGQIYEREFIKKWLKDHDRDPLTNVKLDQPVELVKAPDVLEEIKAVRTEIDGLIKKGDLNKDTLKNLREIQQELQNGKYSPQWRSYIPSIQNVLKNLQTKLILCCVTPPKDDQEIEQIFQDFKNEIIEEVDKAKEEFKVQIAEMRKNGVCSQTIQALIKGFKWFMEIVTKLANILRPVIIFFF